MSIKKNLEEIEEQNTRVRNHVSSIVKNGTNYASSLVRKTRESAKRKREKFMKKKR